jgi:hypothetical protein
MRVIDDKKNYRNYGLTKSPEDLRDYKYSQIVQTTEALPESFMLVTKKVRNQSILGACGGFAYAINAECDGMTVNDFNRLSPLFIYANYILSKNPGGEGVNMRDLLKVATEVGICKEELFPYPTDSLILEKCRKGIFPTISEDAKKDGLTRKLSQYAALSTINDIKNAIYKENGAYIGMLVTDSFEYPQNGVIGEVCGVVRGLHALPFIGWNDNETITYDYSKLTYGDKVTKTYKGCFYFQNSWDETWGYTGIGKVPMELFDLGVKKEFYYNLFNEAWTAIHDKSNNYNPNFHIDHQPVNIEMQIGNSIAIIDGTEKILDAPPMIKNSRTMVPARFIAEALDCNVTWNNDEQKILIQKKYTV